MDLYDFLSEQIGGDFRQPLYPQELEASNWASYIPDWCSSMELRFSEMKWNIDSLFLKDELHLAHYSFRMAAMMQRMTGWN